MCRFDPDLFSRFSLISLLIFIVYHVYIHYIQLTENKAGAFMSEKLPLYEKLISDIKTKIERGVYRTGAKVDWLSQLCPR